PSVAGCYLAPLVLLPDVGTRATLGIAALALVAAAILWPRVRAPSDTPSESPLASSDDRGPRAVPWALPAGAVVALATLLAALAPEGPLREDAGQLLERETSYQTLRVVEAAEHGPVPGEWPLYGSTAALRTRSLRFDEDRTSYQSLRLLDDEARVLTAGRYYDHLVLGAWFDGMPWTREPAGAPAVLVVGYGAGTLHRILDHVAPEGGPRAEVTGVELDPEVLHTARDRLGGLPEGGRLLAADGRAVLEALPASPAFDLIFVDAYQRTQYVPFHLATVECFRACATRLKPGGAIGVNVHAPDGLSGALLAAIATTLSEALPGGGVWLVPNPQYPTNVVVWGMPSGRAPRVAGSVPAGLGGPAHALDRLLVRSPRGTLVLTDERAPVERLSDEGILSDEGAP
ncbi:MAG TPA: fused MFS/spermidine synthase, partial [Planctomycetota bacterium]|nr:fused MFS/spermidine synthase [Planctomycetota bacterium]